MILVVSLLLQPMAESMDHPICSVCLEGFTQDGNKVPKLLPCSHTLCLSCLKQLLRAYPSGPLIIECPECRVVHKVPQVAGSVSFPTNRYVLHTLDLERKITELQNNTMEPLVCQAHQTPCVMFCLKKECWKTLCPKCPMQSHQWHNPVGLAECLQESPELNRIKQDVMETTASLALCAAQCRQARQMVLGKQVEANKAIDETSTELKLMIDKKSKELKEKVQQSCNSELANLETILNDISFYQPRGENFKKEIFIRSEKNMAKAVQQLISFQSRFSDFKISAQNVRSKLRNYNVVHFQNKQVGYSSLMGDIVTKPHEVSQLAYVPSQFWGQQRVFLDGSDRRVSCAPVIHRVSSFINIGAAQQPHSWDGLHRNMPY